MLVWGGEVNEEKYEHQVEGDDSERQFLLAALARARGQRRAERAFELAEGAFDVTPLAVGTGGEVVVHGTAPGPSRRAARRTAGAL